MEQRLSNSTARAPGQSEWPTYRNEESGPPSWGLLERKLSDVIACNGGETVEGKDGMSAT